MLESIHRRLIAVLLLVTIAACASRVPYDPFKVPRDQVIGRIKVVAVTPLILPAGIEESDSVREAFAGLIEARMRAGGYTTIAPQEFERRWKQGAEELGGLFDPQSGQRDAAKVESLRRRVLQSLHADFGVEAVLTVGMRAVPAHFSNGWAYWDGADQQIQPGGFWKAAFLYQSTGTVGALSLITTLSDLENHPLFSNAGGLQVTTMMSFGGEFEPVPIDQLFKDPDRNAKAVNLALGQLTGYVTPTPVYSGLRGTPTPRLGLEESR